MGRLKYYLRRYWRRYFLGAFCLLVTVTLVMWIPWWIREAVRIIEQGGSLSDVTFYAGLIGAAALAQGLVRTYSRALIFNAGRNVEYDLRNDLFAHLQKLPVSFYQSQRTGDLMSRLINDISAVRVMLGPGFLNFISAPLYFIYALALMFSMDARMTLAALAPFPVLILAVGKFRGQIMKRSMEVQQQLSALSSHVQENLSGMHVVKAYAQEKFQTEEFVRLNEDYQQKSMEVARLRGIITPVMQGINGLTILIVIWYGGIRVARGDLLVADIVAFIAYLNVLAWPTAAFGWMFSLVERGRAAMKRLEELFKIEPAIADGESTQPCADSNRVSNSAISHSLTGGRKTATAPLTASVFPSCRTQCGAGWAHWVGQEHRGAVGAALVRRRRRGNSPGWPGYPQALFARSAPNARLRAPGPVSLFHVAQAQPRLRP